ncbi:unnamed protein product, partial [Allacma fusca]
MVAVVAAANAGVLTRTYPNTYSNGGRNSY